MYKVAKKTKEGNRSFYEYASKAAAGNVDAAYAAYLDNVKKGFRKTPKQERRKRPAKAVAGPQNMTEAHAIAATVTKEVMAAIDRIMAEKMAEIEERMDKFNGVMRALIIKQHGLTEAELALLKS